MPNFPTIHRLPMPRWAAIAAPRRTAIATLALLLALSLAIAVCAGPAKVEVPPAADIAVGLDVAKSGAAARLAASMRFQTVSQGPDAPVAG